MTVTEPRRLITNALDVAALVQPGRVNGLAYTDPAVFEAELERIFTGGWVFVGHESEVPEAGDYVTRRLGLDPVIMVRDRSGDVHVMANRCSHRGVTLCQHASGNTGRSRASSTVGPTASTGRCEVCHSRAACAPTARRSV